MKKIKYNRAKFGDVFEIQTPKGYAYLQYTHKMPMYGALIRVLPETYKEKPDEFSKLVIQKERFCTFFPLNAALAKGIVRVVANEEIPKHAKKFPLMRLAGAVDRSGKVLNWWLWDGKKEWRVKKLSAEQQRLSIAEVLNDTSLIDLIVEGWLPINEV